MCQKKQSKNSCCFHLTEKRKNEAVSELNDKLRLEKILTRELRPLFVRMNADFKSVYAATGRVVNFDDYIPDITAVLRKHYQRTQRSFKNNVSKSNGITDIETKQNELLELGLIAWIASMLQSQPQAISDTTGKDAQESINMANAALAEEGAQRTLITIAAAAAVINRRKLFGRLTGIATTETQGAAESTKLMEAEVLSGRSPYTIATDPFVLTRPRDEPIKPGTKQWVTVNDSRVRSTHVNADRQVVELNESFEVGSSQMRHPGDMTLGAPIFEWINCRCSANYQIEDF